MPIKLPFICWFQVFQVNVLLWIKLLLPSFDSHRFKGISLTFNCSHRLAWGFPTIQWQILRVRFKAHFMRSVPSSSKAAAELSIHFAHHCFGHHIFQGASLAFSLGSQLLEGQWLEFCSVYPSVLRCPSFHGYIPKLSKIVTMYFFGCQVLRDNFLTFHFI